MVDDDEDDREVFLEVVSELSPAAISSTAINGADGLAKLASLDTLPHVIFLDLNMPIMNGIEFLRQVKGMDHLKNIPVVIFSTSGDDWAVRQVRDLGATEFITKPSRVNEWRTAIGPFVL